MKTTRMKINEAMRRARALTLFVERAARPYAQWQASRAMGTCAPWTIKLACLAWVGLCGWSMAWVATRLSWAWGSFFDMNFIEFVSVLGSFLAVSIGFSMMVVGWAVLRVATPMARSMAERGEKSAKERLSVRMEVRELEKFIKEVDGPRATRRSRRL